jgi:hypothetical protein
VTANAWPTRPSGAACARREDERHRYHLRALALDDSTTFAVSVAQLFRDVDRTCDRARLNVAEGGGLVAGAGSEASVQAMTASS